MSTLIASFCLDNDESIIIRHDVNKRWIGIKIPSRSGYVWIKNAEFEALREGLWLMEERVRKHEKVTDLVKQDASPTPDAANPPESPPSPAIERTPDLYTKQDIREAFKNSTNQNIDGDAKYWSSDGEYNAGAMSKFFPQEWFDERFMAALDKLDKENQA